MSEEKLKIIKDAIAKEEQNTSNVDELAKRLRCACGGCGANGMSPEIAQMLAKDWRKYVGVLVFVIAMLGAWHLSKNFSNTQAREAATAFGNIQNGYELLNQKDYEAGKVYQNLAKDFETARKSAVYKDLSVIYSALFEISAGREDDASKILKENFKFSGTKKGAKINEEIFVNELAEFISIKLLLTKDNLSDSEKLDARVRLKKLATNSELVMIPAYSLFVTSSTTDDERKEVMELMSSIVNRRPELLQSMMKQQ